MEGNILKELVAKYAGIIYATSCGVPFSLRASSYHLDNQVPGMFYRLADASGELGYRKSEKAFQEHGEALLPEITLISIEESTKSLPRMLPVTFYEKRILPLADKLRILALLPF